MFKKIKSFFQRKKIERSYLKKVLYILFDIENLEERIKECVDVEDVENKIKAFVTMYNREHGGLDIPIWLVETLMDFAKYKAFGDDKDKGGHYKKQIAMSLIKMIVPTTGKYIDYLFGKAILLIK